MDKTPLNPSRKAIKRVKDPLPIPTECNICDGRVRIATHEEVYGGKSFGDWPYVYLCVACGARVGMHPFTNIPLGTLADGRTREARKKNKIYFNRLFLKNAYCDVPVNTRFKCGKRTECYAWLARKLGIEISQCHWGLFDEKMCLIAGDICRHKLMSRGFSREEECQ